MAGPLRELEGNFVGFARPRRGNSQRSSSLSRMGELVQPALADDTRKVVGRPPKAPAHAAGPVQRGRRGAVTRVVLGQEEHPLAYLEACLTDRSEPAEPKGSPTSPVTAMVKRHLDKQPHIAIVRTVSLKDAALHPPVAALGEGNVLAETPVPAAANPVGRRALRESSGEGALATFQRDDKILKRLPSEERTTRASSVASARASLRELSAEEVERRTRTAADFFRAAQATNRRSRGAFEVAAVLADARERAKSASHAVSRDASECASSRSTPSAASGAAAGSTASGTGDGSEAEADAAAAPKKAERKSFMEQFGYGVKPKTPVAAEQVPAPVAPKKTGMIGIKVGSNDLKERLAAKRRNTIS